MLSISHTLTGAFIASKLPHPALYIPLTLATHYLEDWIPHWDVGTGLSNGKRKIKTAFLLEIVDLAVSITAIYFFWQAGANEIQYHIWIGAFISLIPDFLEAPRNFLKWEPFFLKPLNKFHGWFHHSVTNKVLGLTPQVIAVGLIWLLR
ncbi:hypothetical protein KKE34_00210 [Patescibacteria group bacterium]|nr:hypothetical protein [Patescibacteria group bacterium]MBU1885021.1 hypothetical protein [Patescibacteria group bacterium]